MSKLIAALLENSGKDWEAIVPVLRCSDNFKKLTPGINNSNPLEPEPFRYLPSEDSDILTLPPHLVQCVHCGRPVLSSSYLLHYSKCFRLNIPHIMKYNLLSASEYHPLQQSSSQNAQNLSNNNSNEGINKKTDSNKDINSIQIKSVVVARSRTAPPIIQTKGTNRAEFSYSSNSQLLNQLIFNPKLSDDTEVEFEFEISSNVNKQTDIKPSNESNNIISMKGFRFIQKGEEHTHDSGIIGFGSYVDNHQMSIVEDGSSDDTDYQDQQMYDDHYDTDSNFSLSGRSVSAESGIESDGYMNDDNYKSRLITNKEFKRKGSLFTDLIDDKINDKNGNTNQQQEQSNGANNTSNNKEQTNNQQETHTNTDSNQSKTENEQQSSSTNITSRKITNHNTSSFHSTNYNIIDKISSDITISPRRSQKLVYPQRNEKKITGTTPPKLRNPSPRLQMLAANKQAQQLIHKEISISKKASSASAIAKKRQKKGMPKRKQKQIIVHKPNLGIVPPSQTQQLPSHLQTTSAQPSIIKHNIPTNGQPITDPTLLQHRIPPHLTPQQVQLLSVDASNTAAQKDKRKIQPKAVAMQQRAGIASVPPYKPIQKFNLSSQPNQQTDPNNLLQQNAIGSIPNTGGITTLGASSMRMQSLQQTTNTSMIKQLQQSMFGIGPQVQQRLGYPYMLNVGVQPQSAAQTNTTTNPSGTSLSNAQQQNAQLSAQNAVRMMGLKRPMNAQPNQVSNPGQSMMSASMIGFNALGLGMGVGQMNPIGMMSQYGQLKPIGQIQGLSSGINPQQTGYGLSNYLHQGYGMNSSGISQMQNKALTDITGSKSVMIKDKDTQQIGQSGNQSNNSILTQPSNATDPSQSSSSSSQTQSPLLQTLNTFNVQLTQPNQSPNINPLLLPSQLGIRSPNPSQVHITNPQMGPLLHQSHGALSLSLGLSGMGGLNGLGLTTANTASAPLLPPYTGPSAFSFKQFSPSPIAAFVQQQQQQQYQLAQQQHFTAPQQQQPQQTQPTQQQPVQQSTAASSQVSITVSNSVSNTVSTTQPPNINTQPPLQTKGPKEHNEH